jgi:diketogulonate reductase-like aldo/keto reductase
LKPGVRWQKAGMVSERMVENIKLFDFTLSDEDLREICLLDTGRNVTGWPSDALKYNPESV